MVMALTDRIVQVRLSLAGTVITLDESITLRVRIQKAALAIQNKATIEIIGLTGSLREALLSQFTAWNNRKVAEGKQEQKWVDVEVSAGWSAPSKRQAGQQVTKPSVIFKGQVVICELTSPPPNIAVRLTCFTRQIDKTKFVTEPAPAEITYKKYVEWAAKQMGFGLNVTCETSYDNVVLQNPARSIFVSSALLIDIQNMYRPDVAAFIDDDLLIVKDKNKILNPSQTVKVTQFTGIPTWTEWGVEFNCLFDPSIRMAQGVELESKMNPSLNGRYVVMELDYDLTSRDNSFYVKVGASPPA